ncbi:MAG: hypothetical protein E6Q26_07480 [Acinetobacter sp.]|nr:MAG: hypothetical protein E6Q26_07480 [Acinetobacter sp.]
MANSLKDTPSAWVRLDKNAKGPLVRDQLAIDSSDEQTENQHHSSPPLARPLYRPPATTPQAAARSRQQDFSDLPASPATMEQQRTLQPANTLPPTMGNPAPQDALENLIDNIQ